MNTRNIPATLGKVLGAAFLTVMVIGSVASVGSWVWDTYLAPPGAGPPYANDLALTALPDEEPAIIAKIVKTVNAERAAAGAPPVRSNDDLDFAAAARAYDMVEKRYFAHESPTGVRAQEWVLISDYNPLFVAEALAEGFLDTHNLFYQNGKVKGFMFSESHRATILDGRLEEIGVGFAEGPYIEDDGSWKDSKRTIFVVLIFGTARDRN